MIHLRMLDLSYNCDVLLGCVGLYNERGGARADGLGVARLGTAASGYDSATYILREIHDGR
jgi:hypothetical protein